VGQRFGPPRYSWRSGNCQMLILIFRGYSWLAASTDAYPGWLNLDLSRLHFWDWNLFITQIVLAVESDSVHACVSHTTLDCSCDDCTQFWRQLRLKGGQLASRGGRKDSEVTPWRDLGLKATPPHAIRLYSQHPLSTRLRFVTSLLLKARYKSRVRRFHHERNAVYPLQ
jgi:hypothetical protein